MQSVRFLGTAHMYRKFKAADDGTVVVATAAAFTVIMLAIGMALDYGRASSTRGTMQTGLDAATLMALALPDTTTDQNRQMVLTQAYAANHGNGTAQIANSTNTSLTSAANYQMPTSFMGLFGWKTLPISVQAKATKPMMLSSARFSFNWARGAWDKTVFLMGRTSQSAPYQQLMRMVYVYTNTGATGITTVSKLDGASWIDVYRMDCSKPGPCVNTVLGGDGSAEVDISGMQDVYLEMKLSADLGKPVWPYPEAERYIRSNDPTTADQIFIDGTQMATGQSIDMMSAIGCNGVLREHRWEDGGGWASAASAWEGTDFGYSVAGTCSSNGKLVRVTQ